MDVLLRGLHLWRLFIAFLKQVFFDFFLSFFFYLEM